MSDKLKKIIIPILIVIIGGAASWYFLVYKKNGGPSTSGNPEAPKEAGAVWKYEKNIANPIKATSADEDIVLGDIDKDKVTVKIPKGAFDKPTEVSLFNPDSVPNYVGSEIDTSGAPIDLTTGAPVRLNDKVVVSFKYDKDKLDLSQGKSAIRVAYYNGTKWDYIRPLDIDIDKGVITFETYHFSLLGATKIKDETVITEEWIHSQTLDKQLRDNINKVTDHIANQVIDMGLEKMGIVDKSLKGKILGELLKENDYRDVYDAYQKGDTTDAAQKIAVLAGKKMAEIVPPSVLQEHLKNLTADSSDMGSRINDVAAVGKAAGYMAEGNYKDAAKIIGEAILDKTTVGIAGKIAVEVVNGQINDWKNSEVEAAYEAYKHGSNAVFYGYNVDKGDFDSIWDQMRGIRRQLEIEAIRKENEGRADAGLPPLTEAQMDIVRDKVKSSFKNQFTLRSEREDEFKKQEDDLRMLVEAFKKNNLFDSVMGPSGLDKGLDLENKLDVLNHFAEKMMQDTKRFQLSDKNGLIMEDKISVDDIAQGARIWFSGPDGKKKYQQYLKDRFNIDPYPPLKYLAGSWSNGKMVITDVIIPEELKNQPKKEGEDGCDFSMDLSQLKGKEVPITLALNPQGDNGGTLSFGSKDNGDKAVPFTYEDGVIKATTIDKGAVATFELPVSSDQNGYAIGGSMTVTYKGEGGVEAKILASISASKSASSDKPAK